MRPKVPKHKRMEPSGKDPAHLNLIRELPCILSGRPAEAAHLRSASPEHGKDYTGMAQKPDDRWVVPLAPELHRMLPGSQHSMNEIEWWKSMDVDPFAVAKELYGADLETALKVIDRYRPRGRAQLERIAAILKGKI